MSSYEKYGPFICISVILAILFVLWAFFGGKDCEFVGLAPLASASQPLHTGSIYQWGNNTEPEVCVKDNLEEVIIENHSEAYPSIVVDNTPIVSEKFTSDPQFICENIPKKSYPLDLKVSDVLPVGFIDKANGGPLKKGRGKGRFISRGERLCKQTLERIYGLPFVTVRPSWLTNPETQEPLELDCYNDDLKIAVEYNGEQHYKWPNFTNQSYNQFINQVRRDKFKMELCEKLGVYLIIVPYNIKYEKIPSYILSHLPEIIRNRITEEGTLDDISKI
jgi:hypothetical protein